MIVLLFSVALASFQTRFHNYTLYTACDADNGLIKVVVMQFELKGPGQQMVSTPKHSETIKKLGVDRVGRG